MKTYFSIILLSLLLFCFKSHAQNTIGGTPPSFTNEDVAAEYVDMIDLTVPDMATIEKEDNEAEALGIAYRYGFSIPVDMGMDNAGTWSYLPDGSKIWRLEVRAAHEPAEAGADRADGGRRQRDGRRHPADRDVGVWRH